jgi:hypothetical protein
MTRIQLINTDPSGAGQANINQCKTCPAPDGSVFNIFNNLKRLARENEGAKERRSDLSERAIKNF